MSAHGAPVTSDGHVIQTQASTGMSVNHWTGVTQGMGILVAAGKVFVSGSTGNLYVIDPTMAPGVLTSVATLPDYPLSIAFDGTHIWTANASGSVSIIDPQSYTVNTVSTGFNEPTGILYDGAHIWGKRQPKAVLTVRV